MIWRVLGFAYYAAGCFYAWKHTPTLSPFYWRNTVASLREQRLPVLLAPLLILVSLAVDLALWPWDWWRWRRILKRGFPTPPASAAPSTPPSTPR